MTFGEKVRALRRSARLTQSQLAEQIGVTLRTVQGYESGTSYPKQREIYRKLADLFGCDVNYLLTEDTPSGGRSGSLPDLSVRARALSKELCVLLSSASLDETTEDALMQELQNAYWTSRRKRRS